MVSEFIARHPWLYFWIGALAIGCICAPRLSFRMARWIITAAFFVVLLIVMSPLSLAWIALERVGLVTKFPSVPEDLRLLAYRQALARLNAETVGLMIPNDGVSRPPFE
jgi:hypothetical protein